jgi:threonylcarbamoyladenosine tRNA methylthiotransferase MtaB
MPTFTITTLGCRVNQCESESIAQGLKDTGWQAAAAGHRADACIINTCSVTGKAGMQSRQVIRQLIRTNPGARIIVTGCHAQTHAEQLRAISGVTDIIGHADKHKIPAILAGAPRKTLVPTIDQERRFGFMPAAVAGNHTRPSLKIQDGCDAFCTYCIVPYARGRSRSMPAATVLEQLARLKQAGYRETVLSGIHLGRWGQDLEPKSDLLALLETIQAAEAMDRVRLSSIEPAEITNDLIDFVAESDRVCRHFHIPLQSGDDTILSRMKRPYTREQFQLLVTRIRNALPDAGIGADVLVGFPGETEAAFENTVHLIESLPLTYLHVFPFSPRKGTPAATFPDPVPDRIVKNRCRQLRELGLKKKNTFYISLLGRRLQVLIEGSKDHIDGARIGTSSNFVPVHIHAPGVSGNPMVTVRIDRIGSDGCLWGDLIDAG